MQKDKGTIVIVVTSAIWQYNILIELNCNNKKILPRILGKKYFNKNIFYLFEVAATFDVATLPLLNAFWNMLPKKCQRKEPMFWKKSDNTHQNKEAGQFNHHLITLSRFSLVLSSVLSYELPSNSFNWSSFNGKS